MDLIQDAKGVLLPMVDREWKNFLAATALGKEIDFDMEFAKEIIEPKVFNKILQQYDSLKNSVANVAIIHSISNADISETIEGFNETIDNEVETGVKTFIEGEKEKKIYLDAVVARNTAMDSNPVLFISQTNNDVKKLVEELETIDAVKNNELYLQKKLALVNELVETQTDMGQAPYKIKVMSNSEADSFVVRYNNGDSKTRVAMLANLEAEFGEYNSQAMLQLSNAGLPITAELSSFFGNPTITNRFINYDQKEEQEKLKKFAKDNDIDFKKIEANISAEIQEFEDIIAKNNNINTSKAIAKLHNIKKVLAYDVLNSMWVDGNLDQDDAETKAASLIKDHFVIEDTYYVPTIYNGEDIKHTIESDTGIIGKADLIQKHYLDEFNAVSFESENKDVTEVQLTEEMKEQMEDNGEWRNTADGNGLIFGIVFPDDSFAPVKNASGEFLTFNFDDTSLTLPGTNIELEYSKQIESDLYASYKGGNYASRNIVAMNEAIETDKKTKNILTNETIINDWSTLYQTTNDPKKNKRALKAISKDYKVPDEAVKAIDAASTVFEGDKNLTKQELIEYANAIGQIESGYKTKVQIGGGPARSYWQVEPKTALDLLNNSSAIFGKKFEELFSGKSKYTYSGDGQSAVKYLSSLSEEKMSILLKRDDTLAAVMALAVIVNRK
jgi:hypothetical protein